MESGTIDKALAAADRALGKGDVAGARAMLEPVAVKQPRELDFWRKLATLRRMAGEPIAALAAIDSALELAPLDFLSLLFRAGILDQQDSPQAGEAYGRALAQQPPGTSGPVPPAVLDRARQVYGLHQRQVEARIAEAAQAAGLQDDARFARFASNTSRRTRTFHRDPTHFDYPGLPEIEFYDSARFPWLAQWEAASDMIAAEFAALLAAESAELVPYVQYDSSAPLAQWQALNHSRDWTAIHLVKQGETVAANARHCPQTMALLAGFPQPQIAGCGPNAMFSLLAPHTHIPPHTGVANFRLVAHLPLQVPPGCWFRVGAQRREWQVGEAFVFDDTIEHEAANDSDTLRVVMIIDCWHPDLNDAEQAAIAAAVGAMASDGIGL